MANKSTVQPCFVLQQYVPTEALGNPKVEAVLNEIVTLAGGATIKPAVGVWLHSFGHKPIEEGVVIVEVLVLADKAEAVAVKFDALADAQIAAGQALVLTTTRHPDGTTLLVSTSAE